MSEVEKEIIEEHNARQLNIKAINEQRRVVEREEHDLLVLIALKRASEGRTGRFPFKFSGHAREEFFVAYIEDHTKMRAGHCLVIDHYKTSLNYFACDIRHAEGIRKKLVK
jgi:hypothetical protein